MKQTICGGKKKQIDLLNPLGFAAGWGEATLLCSSASTFHKHSDTHPPLDLLLTAANCKAARLHRGVSFIGVRLALYLLWRDFLTLNGPEKINQLGVVVFLRPAFYRVAGMKVNFKSHSVSLVEMYSTIAILLSKLLHGVFVCINMTCAWFILWCSLKH